MPNTCLQEVLDTPSSSALLPSRRFFMPCPAMDARQASPAASHCGGGERVGLSWQPDEQMGGSLAGGNLRHPAQACYARACWGLQRNLHRWLHNSRTSAPFPLKTQTPQGLHNQGWGGLGWSQSDVWHVVHTPGQVERGTRVDRAYLGHGINATCEVRVVGQGNRTSRACAAGGVACGRGRAQWAGGRPGMIGMPEAGSARAQGETTGHLQHGAQAGRASQVMACPTGCNKKRAEGCHLCSAHQHARALGPMVRELSQCSGRQPPGGHLDTLPLFIGDACNCYG